MKYKLRIDNGTIFRKGDLRKITMECLRRYADPGRVYVATFRHARQKRWITGHAYLYSGLFQINIPKRKLDDRLLRDLAMVIRHELMHCHGFRGERHMISHKNKAPEGLYDWALDYEVRLKPGEVENEWSSLRKTLGRIADRNRAALRELP